MEIDLYLPRDDFRNSLSRRHARKDAERIENGIRRTVRLWETSNYWKRGAAGAIRHTKYERPDVRGRRIRGLEADRRKQERNEANAEKFLQWWNKAETLAFTRIRRAARIDAEHYVLEPSAGTGNIVRAIREHVGNAPGLTAVEINPRLAKALGLWANRTHVGDFLECNGDLGTFDRSWEELPDDTFAGTGVRTVLLTIEKD
jgi:hypothetical protein